MTKITVLGVGISAFLAAAPAFAFHASTATQQTVSPTTSAVTSGATTGAIGAATQDAHKASKTTDGKHPKVVDGDKHSAGATGDGRRRPGGRH